jgi:hypothetical protein
VKSSHKKPILPLELRLKKQIPISNRPLTVKIHLWVTFPCNGISSVDQADPGGYKIPFGYLPSPSAHTLQMNPLPTKQNRWRPITVFNLLVGLLFSLSALAQPAFLKEGLVAYYPFNGNANDESGNNLNPTVVKDVSLVEDRNNKLGSYRFNGVSSFIEIPEFIQGKEYTFSGWVKQDLDQNFSNYTDAGASIFVQGARASTLGQLFLKQIDKIRVDSIRRHKLYH